MTDERAWVMDTSTYTHFCRAGRGDVIEALAPGGVILVPDQVNTEIEAGRSRYRGIPAVASVPWAETVVLTEQEDFTVLQVKAQMRGRPDQHLGECAVIACAHHRGLVAILDEREAVVQADLRHVVSHDSLWIVIEAYRVLFDRSRQDAVDLVESLLGTDMYLPLGSGESLISYAYENGLLP